VLDDDLPGAVGVLCTGIFELEFSLGRLTLLSPPRLIQPRFDPALHRFNEGACDPGGRFWVKAEPDAAELHNGMT